MSDPKEGSWCEDNPFLWLTSDEIWGDAGAGTVGGASKPLRVGKRL